MLLLSNPLKPLCEPYNSTSESHVCVTCCSSNYKQFILGEKEEAELTILYQLKFMGVGTSLVDGEFVFQLLPLPILDYPHISCLQSLNINPRQTALAT